ncbi:MAG: hypothetical protein ABFD79_02125 [Phycisphaerales bacterium]
MNRRYLKRITLSGLIILLMAFAVFGENSDANDTQNKPKDSNSAAQKNIQAASADVNETMNEIMSLASQIASETLNLGKLKAKKAPQEEIDKAEKNIKEMKDKMKVLGGKLGENAEVFSSLMAEKILGKIHELSEKYNVPVKDEILEQIRTAIKAAVEAMDSNSVDANN